MNCVRCVRLSDCCIASENDSGRRVAGFEAHFCVLFFSFSFVRPGAVSLTLFQGVAFRGVMQWR